MNIISKTVNKIYGYLPKIVIGILICLSVLTLISPLSHQISSWPGTIVYALILPATFLIGYYCKVKKLLKVSEFLIFVGCLLAIIVLISAIITWVQYGFFHALIYKDTPIYYWNGSAYDITKEVSFFVSTQIQTVSINYAGTFGLYCAALFPASFFINRKEKKAWFYLSLSIGIIGIVAIATVPNIPALIVLGVSSLFALIYKFYWTNKKIINLLRYIFYGLIGLAVVVYLIVGINVLAGFKLSGFVEKVFVSNGYMAKVSSVLEGMNLKEESQLINFFGLDFNYAVKTTIEEIASTQTGIFEVELIKEVGVLGVTLTMILIIVLFRNFDKQLSDGENTDFERVGSTILVISIFVYCSLFYDSMPCVYSNDYSPVLRFTPILIILFLLGIMSFVPNQLKEEKNEK